MSEFSSVAPPPPPPPPPPPRPSSAQFDFVRPFAFVFEDERWIHKVLVGGLFYIAAFVLIGLFFIAGYCARLTRNVIAGMDRPLPEWDDLSTYFTDGVKLAVVGLGYTLPLMALVFAIIIPAGVLGAIAGDRNAAAQLASGGMFTCVWCLFIPISLAMSFWLPGALLFAIVEDRISAGFDFKRIYNFIKNNFVNYLMAFVVMMVVRFIVPFGMILLCIGIVFTAFWSFVVSAYAFAQAYRQSPTK